jgi:hypothetical protein
VSQPAGPVKFVVGALRGLDWSPGAWGQAGDWTACTYVCICGGCLGGPADPPGRLLAVTGARCPLTKPVVAAVEQQAGPLSPIAAGACSPAVFARTPAGAARVDRQRPGAGLALRPQVPPMPLWFYILVTCNMGLARVQKGASSRRVTSLASDLVLALSAHRPGTHQPGLGTGSPPVGGGRKALISAPRIPVFLCAQRPM